MKIEDKKVCEINDKRLINYENRSRSGSTQVFYTGNDSRDFERYQKEGGVQNGAVKMHDKKDTINLEPPEKHYYSELIDGKWWWINGCAECNGEPRDWMTYIECDKHDVCRTCGCDRSVLTEPPWGGKNGWQCKPCADAENEANKREALEKMKAKEYDEWDYHGTDNILCPHCEYSYEPDSEPPEGNQECSVCGGVYSVEPEYSISFTTKVIGKRIVA